MWIECVPNVSEGRRADVIARGAAAIRDAGAALLDVSSDAAHHRSVYTFAGDPDEAAAGAIALVGSAVADIDLRAHRGEHPRIGAVDVLPFVPLSGASMADAVALARRVAAEVARRFDLPVYLYEEAAVRRDRTRLEHIRRGGFEGLAGKMRAPEWAPDFGPSVPHPTAGAAVIGARPFLIAYNVTLASDRLDVVKAIARTIRESSGGFPAVKAMGLALAPGVVQVSMNLTDFTQTSIVQVFDAISAEAERHGLPVLGSELIGLAPAAALSAEIAAHVRLAAFSADRILENRLARVLPERRSRSHF